MFGQKSVSDSSLDKSWNATQLPGLQNRFHIILRVKDSFLGRIATQGLIRWCEGGEGEDSLSRPSIHQNRLLQACAASGKKLLICMQIQQ